MAEHDSGRHTSGRGLTLADEGNRNRRTIQVRLFRFRSVYFHITARAIELMNHYRVTILGGGPAGCAAAMTLRQFGVDDILLVESGDYDATRVGESIPPDTRRLLESLNLFDAFVAEGHDVCFGSCSSWGSDELGYNDFLFNPYGNGWHLDRKRFDAFLGRSAADRGIEMRRRTTFLRGARATDGFQLTLRSDASETGEEIIHSDFVIDATGFHAAFAQGMGATKRFHDRLICIYGFFENTTSSFTQLTMLEAAEYGWWYGARLPGNRLTAAVATDPDILKIRDLNRHQGWVEALAGTRHLGPALEGCPLDRESIRAWPAHSFLLDHPVGDGWLAVGDAASVYDPISSQGIYKGLSTGIRGGEALAAYIEGDTTALNGYGAAVARDFELYLTNRNYFYNLEKRWPDSMFWARRRMREEAEATPNVKDAG